ncbi:NUDIX hydrolase family protein [Branchiibius sp. NY16-3462-2]|uniref:NUDIX hydrolase family protein n=1 Tax=Branchiibius sp. NY16-3462-2 TaxID=1807500 RepID=UPI000795EFBB|nr:NUDIX hydrolase family protein [Branchiibius sp. NY16-3462-2]KYH44559.1 ADP-ribose pyrophosphatase [Branchiibius sp. NY16-3462-2]
MATLRTPDPNPGWLSELALQETRARVPMLYVEAIPVRLDDTGRIEHVGLLLRGSATGEMSRSFVSGRVFYGESVREALMRNLEKDLGPAAFPRLPVSTVPFSVAEYLPVPGVSPLHDPRQHAVALTYVVPVVGECDPRQDALELTWLTPQEAVDASIAAELDGGRAHLLRQALAYAEALG